jgi:lipoprotein-anchoring transpeptidase ErfK/SrfK
VTESGRVLKVYDIAVGKPSTPSPTGELKVINKLVDPTYHHQGKVVPPGKSNPLGNRWMGLSAKGYGIHGTNVQSSVGKAASHGCIRMRKHDVEELFTLVRVGDVVVIHAERDPQVAGIFASPAVVAQSAPAPSVQRPPQPSLAEMAAMVQEIGD